MSATIWGIVKGGLVVPDEVLPEGTRVEIRPAGAPAGMPPELWEEIQGWDAASADSLERVERLAGAEGAADEAG